MTTPHKPARKPAKKPTAAPGVKMLLTVLTIGVILGGWALLAVAELKPTASTPPPVQESVEGDTPPQPPVSLEFGDIPTVVPPPDNNPEPVVVPVKAEQPAPAPQPTLRQVAAPTATPTPVPAPPAPVTSSRSS